jgi:uncharacterized coiled-coil DUF342 family protein
MKLVDEKKALAEISTLRRSRKTLEASGSIDDAIAADRARIDELKKQLDDPESRKVSDKFDTLKKEMDGLREEGNKAYEERNKLFDERNALSAQLVSEIALVLQMGPVGEVEEGLMIRTIFTARSASLPRPTVKPTTSEYRL